MDLGGITNTTERLLRNQQQAQLEQIVTIAKTLGLKTGSEFLAQVEKAVSVTPEQRAELIKTIDAALAQLNKNSAAPTVKALIVQLLEQKDLAQQPTLKLISLIASNPLLANPSNTTSPTTHLLTYSTQQLQAGQTLLMQLASGQRLQLIQPLTETEATQIKTLLATTASPTLKTDSPKDITSLLTNLHTGTQVQTSTKVTEAISETLRQLLPQKDKGQDLLSALPKVLQFVQQMPIAERKEWFSSELQQSLKTLANHIRQSDQLSNPKLLEMVLKNNGQSFEHKLAQLIAPIHKDSGANTTNKNTGSNQLSDLVKTVAANPLTSSNLPSKPFAASANTQHATTAIPIGNNPAIPIQNPILSTPASLISPSNEIAQKAVPTVPNTMAATAIPNSVSKLTNQDFKGSLLSLLHQLDAELPASTATANTNILGITSASSLPMATPLPHLLGLIMNKQSGELNQKQLRTQLIMLMHQYTLGSLAKIQLQQIQTVSHQLTQTDQAQPTQSWQFEVPVRQGQDVHPLNIQLEQQWIEDPQESTTKEARRVRQWNIMLSFNLPIVGQFYAQLHLLGESLSAKFWAENETTLQEAKIKLDSLKAQLESEGIQVTQLQCVPGLPPKPKMSLSYSLVDIKT